MSSEQTKSEETMTIPGIGEIQTPSSVAEQNRSKYDTEHVPVPHECPVVGCVKTGFQNFKQLRGHFGNVSDGVHRAYDLSIDDYRDND